MTQSATKSTVYNTNFKCKTLWLLWQIIQVSTIHGNTTHKPLASNKLCCNLCRWYLQFSYLICALAGNFSAKCFVLTVANL